MKHQLENLLGCSVDIVSRRSVPDTADNVAEEAIPL